MFFKVFFFRLEKPLKNENIYEITISSIFDIGFIGHTTIFKIFVIFLIIYRVILKFRIFIGFYIDRRQTVFFLVKNNTIFN